MAHLSVKPKSLNFLRDNKEFAVTQCSVVNSHDYRKIEIFNSVRNRCHNDFIDLEMNLVKDDHGKVLEWRIMHRLFVIAVT